jgi:serine/threonine-protein kinase RsbT
VLKGGYSTSKGLGVGLSGSKRIMDEFEIQSLVDVGTMITAVKWLR